MFFNSGSKSRKNIKNTEQSIEKFAETRKDNRTLKNRRYQTELQK